MWKSSKSIPMIILTGRAETPKETDTNTSNSSPPIRMQKANHIGLKPLCCEDKNTEGEVKREPKICMLQRA